jgi:hypothetical protein
MERAGAAACCSSLGSAGGERGRGVSQSAGQGNPQVGRRPAVVTAYASSCATEIQYHNHAPERLVARDVTGYSCLPVWAQPQAAHPRNGSGINLISPFLSVLFVYTFRNGKSYYFFPFQIFPFTFYYIFYKEVLLTTFFYGN